jgi:hypothetical protein
VKQSRPTVSLNAAHSGAAIRHIPTVSRHYSSPRTTTGIPVQIRTDL